MRDVRRGVSWVGAAFVLAGLGWLAAVLFPTSSFGGAGANGLPVWSAPAIVDRVAPTRSGAGLASVSCASEHLCVAVADGVVLSTTSPLSPGPWQQVAVPSSLDAVSCPSVALC